MIVCTTAGSKTAIHKYLKELEEEQGVHVHPASWSDELQTMVAKLADRLCADAEAIVAGARTVCAAELQKRETFTEQLRLELASSRERERGLQQRLAGESSAHNTCKEQLMEARLESAAQGREIKLLEKELTRMQGLHGQLMEEKINWRHERAQLEEMLSQKEQD